jgi:hypothetical protein
MLGRRLLLGANFPKVLKASGRHEKLRISESDRDLDEASNALAKVGAGIDFARINALTSAAKAPEGCDQAMFLGHFAVGFMSKRVAPQTSLVPLIAAPVLLDILWPIFILLGIEHARISPGDTVVTPMDFYDYPYSHSLLMAGVWSVLGAAAAYFAFRRQRLVSVVIGLGIFSHWVLDWISHRPDLTLYPGSFTKVGLGLWNSLAATIAVEGAIFIAGVAVYATSTRAVSRGGGVAFWAFVAFLVLAYVGNLLGPPPPSMNVVAVTAIISTVIFLVWIA